jgi:hypothetical protein
MAYTRHLLDGHSSFDALTRPTVTELEKFIDRASGLLNNCILGAGFTPSVVAANSTAVLALDDWVTNQAAMMVELTQRAVGWTDDEGSRTGMFHSLASDACEYVDSLSDGWKNAGLTVADPAHLGLTFTALDKRSERADPDSTTLEQPKFRRGQFDNE